MKKLQILEESLENRITLLHLGLFLICLPFDRIYSELILISLFCHTLIHFRKDRLKNMHWQKWLLLPSVYLLTVTGTFYTSYTTIALGLWEKQLAIILFPIIFFLSPLDLKKYSKPLLLLFAGINTLVIAYLYFDAVSIILFYDMPFLSLFSGLFFSHKFSEPLEIHSTYLSLYCAISLVTVVLYLIKEKISAFNHFLLFAAIMILSAGIIQLGSRAVIAGLLIILILVIPFFISRPRSGNIYLAFTLACCVVAGIAIYISDGLRYRYVNSLQTDLAIRKESFSISDPRAERWKLGWELVKERPVLGHGTGDEVPKLKEKYFNNKLYDSYLHELNAHNQYLSFLIKGGIFALLVFSFTLFHYTRMAVKKADPCFLSFMVLVITVCVSENILNVNKGIFFYAFFLSFFAMPYVKTIVNTQRIPATGNRNSKSNVFTRKELTA